MGDRTYQRVWPLVMAHLNGAPFLLFDVARRFVRAHASFIRSSTVSVCEWSASGFSHKMNGGPSIPSRKITIALLHVSDKVYTGPT
jgi:hypothetical protein